MVDFIVPCSTYRRIARAALQHDEADSRKFLQCVRLEIHTEHILMIAACGPILVVERIKSDGENADAGAVVHVTVEPEFLEFVERGVSTDDVLIVSPVPSWTAARLASGAMYFKNAEWPGADQYPNWREIIPADLPNKTTTALAFNGDEIKRMSETAPSGEFVCPKFIDTNRPVIVRDIADSEWCGVFLSQDHNGRPFDPAKIPDWVR